MSASTREGALKPEKSMVWGKGLVIGASSVAGLSTGGCWG